MSDHPTRALASATAHTGLTAPLTPSVSSSSQRIRAVSPALSNQSINQVRGQALESGPLRLEAQLCSFPAVLLLVNLRLPVCEMGVPEAPWAASEVEAGHGRSPREQG